MPKLTKFPSIFWLANLMELFERWAWYGMFVIIALYLTGPKATGALEFSQSQKGLLMGTIVAILYLLPIFTGIVADKTGYRKVLLIAYIILATGYLLLGYFTSFWSVYAAFLFLAIGAALFKPIIPATISQNSSPAQSSLAFGIYYTIINVGGFIGPLVASKLRLISWQYVFYASSAAILLNLVLAIFFYKQPQTTSAQKQTIKQLITTTLKSTFQILTDKRLSLLLLILVGYWVVFWQLFYALPNFIEQWCDTRMVYNFINNLCPWLAQLIGTKQGTIPTELFINIDSALIIIFMVTVAWFTSKISAINSMLLGTILSVISISFAFLTQNGALMALAIAIGAFGEMACSPKSNQYIGSIAPQGKTAGYMGASFLPFAGGTFFAGILAGPLYQAWSDKPSIVIADLLHRFPQLYSTLNNASQSQIWEIYLQKTGFTTYQANQYLWNTYQPYKIAYIFAIIGIFTIVALFLYNKILNKTKNEA